MLGSNVFKFSMTAVPAQVQAYLARENLAPQDIDLFLFHQGSRFIVDNLTRKLGLPPEKVPFEAGADRQHGILVAAADAQAAAGCAAAAVLLSGFGVGLSWATMVLESGCNHRFTEDCT